MTSTREDFGHRPVVINRGMCGGCEQCPDEEREVCQRCITIWREPGYVQQFNENDEPTEAVLGWTVGSFSSDWPCTSAIVLGLAERLCPTCDGTGGDHQIGCQP